MDKQDIDGLDSFVWVDDIQNYDIPPRKSKTVIPHQNKFKSMDYEVVLDYHVPFPTKLLYGDSVESIHIYSITPGYTFYENILKTYYHPSELERQFRLDVSRSTMYLNQHVVRQPLAAIHYLQHKYQEKADLILALCTQAVYASPFEWIYFSLPPNYHLVEGDATSNSDRKIKIILEGHQLSVWKMLRIIRFKQIPDTDHSTIEEVETYRDLCLTITVEDLRSGSDDVVVDVWLSQPYPSN
jgi:hypothetical protein